MSDTIELLKVIAENTSTNVNPVWIALITGGTAVLTASITIGGSIFIQHKNKELEYNRLSIEVVTKERLIWLKELRELASDNYQHLDIQYDMLKRPITIPTADYQAQLDEISKEILKKSNDIILMLDLQILSHVDIYNNIQNVQIFILDCMSKSTKNLDTFNDSIYSKIKNDFFNAMRDINNETWNKIEKLK